MWIMNPHSMFGWESKPYKLYARGPIYDCCVNAGRWLWSVQVSGQTFLYADLVLSVGANYIPNSQLVLPHYQFIRQGFQHHAAVFKLPSPHYTVDKRQDGPHIYAIYSRIYSRI